MPGEPTWLKQPWVPREVREARQTSPPPPAWGPQAPPWGPGVGATAPIQETVSYSPHDPHPQGPPNYQGLYRDLARAAVPAVTAPAFAAMGGVAGLGRAGTLFLQQHPWINLGLQTAGAAGTGVQFARAAAGAVAPQWAERTGVKLSPEEVAGMHSAWQQGLVNRFIAEQAGVGYRGQTQAGLEHQEQRGWQPSQRQGSSSDLGWVEPAKREYRVPWGAGMQDTGIRAHEVQHMRQYGSGRPARPISPRASDLYEVDAELASAQGRSLLDVLENPIVLRDNWDYALAHQFPFTWGPHSRYSGQVERAARFRGLLP